jgi:hypothetical protein
MASTKLIVCSAMVCILTIVSCSAEKGGRFGADWKKHLEECKSQSEKYKSDPECKTFVDEKSKSPPSGKKGGKQGKGGKKENWGQFMKQYRSCCPNGEDDKDKSGVGKAGQPGNAGKPGNAGQPGTGVQPSNGGQPGKPNMPAPNTQKSSRMSLPNPTPQRPAP